jgi:ferredoxin
MSQERAGLRAWVDGAMCIGSATCVSLLPDAFALDDDGTAHFLDPSEVDEERLRQAARSCPTGAIFLEE